jgi:hypothetical protein
MDIIFNDASHLWNPNVHYHVHVFLLLIPFLTEVNQFCTYYFIFLRSLLIISSYLRPYLPSSLPVQQCPNKIVCMFVIFLKTMMTIPS